MFSEEKLVSFSLNMGCTINVVYLESGHVWTLTITENDMGANLGSENERKAVQGRVLLLKYHSESAQNALKQV